MGSGKLTPWAEAGSSLDVGYTYMVIDYLWRHISQGWSLARYICPPPDGGHPDTPHLDPYPYLRVVLFTFFQSLAFTPISRLGGQNIL